MKRFNILVTAGIIGIIFLILIPLPTPILDFLFILNISLSLLILVMSMYIRETLEFSVFPSLLLITTLFRLGLNISSTRKILFDNGYAGQVVKTFGQFVIRGNAVIGFIIFLIIVLVQFIVITKGSERVAEVAARFTLDAMPGKQMAIDADLNSGLIDEQQARERRSKIQREADFFGSMDGATKFVKGDAIISIIITFINFVGGLIVGIMNSQGSIQDIMQIYTTSTIGDGLAHIGCHWYGGDQVRFGEQPQRGPDKAVPGPAKGAYDGWRRGRVPVPYTRLPCSSDTDYIRGHGWGRLLSVPAPEEPGGGDCGRTGGDRGYQRGVLL